MGKRSKLSKDAFDWVKPTTQETQPSPQEEAKEAEKAIDKRSRIPSKKAKQILVKYKKRSGEIVAISEIPLDQETIAVNPFVIVPDEDGVEGFDLTNDLLKKDVLEIHTKYKVDTSGKAPKLVLKR